MTPKVTHFSYIKPAQPKRNENKMTRKLYRTAFFVISYEHFTFRFNKKRFLIVRYDNIFQSLACQTTTKCFKTLLFYRACHLKAISFHNWILNHYHSQQKKDKQPFHLHILWKFDNGLYSQLDVKKSQF